MKPRNKDLLNTFCPTCRTHLDGATSTQEKGAPPCVGAISVCLYCGAVSFFEPDLTLRLATDGELANVRREDPESYAIILKAKRLINGMRRTRQAATN